MLKSYLRTALRAIRKQKGYTFINILGLSIGLACSFFILLWVLNEVSFDRFHSDGDRLFQAMRHGYLSDQVYTWTSVPKPMADALEKDYPEVEDAILVTWPQRQLITAGDKTFRKEGVQAGTAFFQAFTFPLLIGDAATALQDPESILISRSLAESLFGTDWASADLLSRTLTIDHEKDFRVTGVFDDVPVRSSLTFDYVLPIEEYIRRNDWVENWGNSGLRLYVRLRPDADYQTFNKKIEDLIRDNNGFANATPFLHPYTDLRLRSEFRDGKLVGGRIVYVRIFSVVAVFLLLIACINFMNLATARSMKRAKEIGVRKVIGATQPSLIRQFMGESLLLAMVAFVLSCLLVVALLPVFNSVTAETLTLRDLNLPLIGLMLGIALLTGIIAGSYPALYMASFNPIGALKGSLRHRSSAGTLRKGLVIFQFVLSTLLIAGTLAIHSQIRYIQNKNLGMDRQNLVYLELEGPIRDQYDVFRQQLLARPGIESVTTSNQNPLQVGNNTTAPEWDAKEPDNNTLFYIITANYGFVETMKMELVEGRDFSEEFGGDSTNYVINERAAAAMGMKEAVGQRLSLWGRDGQIVGIVKDFHMSSLYNAIEPTIIRLNPEDTYRLYVRAEPGKTTEALASLEAIYKQFNTDYPFEYEFLDKNFEETYRSELVMGRLANAFAFIAIFVSCLGLFGLASFTAEQRTKEIGVRKVLGASVGGLVVFMSKEVTRLVIAAFIIAVPLAYYAVNRWLNHFEYHVDFPYALFVVAGVTAVLIAWLTVSYHSVRAALADPVKSLRYE